MIYIGKHFNKKEFLSDKINLKNSSISLTTQSMYSLHAKNQKIRTDFHIQIKELFYNPKHFILRKINSILL